MKVNRPWLWVLLIFIGSLPVGGALQYYFSGEPARNSSSRNWLAVGQAVLGLLIIAFALYRQTVALRQIPYEEEKTRLDLDS